MPNPTTFKARRPATAPRKTAPSPATARQQTTAAAITHGRPDPVADSHAAVSNASLALAMQAAPPPAGGVPPLDPVRMLRTGQDIAGNAAVAGFATRSIPVSGPPARSGPVPLIVPPGPKPKGNPGLWERFTGAVGGALDWGMEHIIAPLRRLVARAGATLMRFKDGIVTAYTDANISGWDWVTLWHVPVKMFFAQRRKMGDEAVAEERRQRAAAAAERGIPPDRVEPGPVERMDGILDGMESMAEGVMGVQNEILEGAILGDFKEDPSIWNTVGQIAMGFVPYAGQVADARDTIAAVIKLHKSGWKDPYEWINLVLTLIAWVPGIGDIVKGAGKGLLRLIRGSGGGFLRQGRRLWSALFKHGGRLLDKARKFGRRLVAGIRGFGGRLLGWVDGLGRQLTRTADRIAGGVRDLVTGAFRKVDGIITTVRTKANEFLDAAQGFLRRVPGAVRGLADRAINALRSAIDNVLGLVRRVVDAGRRLMNRLIEAITNLVRKALELASDAMKWAARTVKDLIDRAITAARDALAAGRRIANDIWNRGRAAIRSLTEKAKRFIKDKVIKFVRDLWTRIKNRFVSFFKRKWEELKRRFRGKDPKKDKPDAHRNKLAELPRALAEARVIAETHDRQDSSIPVVIGALNVLKRRYRWIRSFVARPKPAPGAYSIHMMGSSNVVDPHYTTRPAKPLYWRPSFKTRKTPPDGAWYATDGGLDAHQLTNYQWDGHHVWPKYVGGPKAQPLMSVRSQIHQNIVHPGLHTTMATVAAPWGFTLVRNRTDRAFINHLHQNPRDRTTFAAAMIGYYASLNLITHPTIPPAAYTTGVSYSYTRLT
jgi:hypothetical protein